MNSPHFPQMKEKQKTDRIAFGVLVIGIGLILLLKKMDLLIYPVKLWPLILIAIGVYIGIKNSFRRTSSWALILIGVLFLIPRFWIYDVLSVHLVAPILLIALGLFLIFKPPHRHRPTYEALSDADTLDIDVSFGERSTVVTSKNFKGGYVSSNFSETRINLFQADSTEPMRITLKVSFGSVEILVPAHWDVQLLVDNSLASVEDKRYMTGQMVTETRLLILDGSCSFGSIIVKSA